MRYQRKLLITGGHVTPALAVIDALYRKKLPCELIFVGRKYVNRRETAYSFEYNEVIKRDIPFIHMEAGRLTRVVGLQSFYNLLKVPAGFLMAFKILAQQKPDIVLTFGGYIGLPIALAARMQGIRVYSHEQTICPGLANRMISRLARKTFVSFPQSAVYFDKSRVLVTGNPLRQSVFTSGKPVFIMPSLPCIYITGGSLGAHSVNTHIERILPDLLKKYVVIHQTGNVAEFKDFQRLLELKNSLSSDLSERYFPKEHFSDEEIGWVYSVAKMVVGRSGANTFFELMALKKPAVFIPLPWSAHDEQRRQALLFKESGLGEIFEQNRPSSELFRMINSVMDTLDSYRKHFDTLPHHYHTHAQDAIVENIFEE